MEDLKTAAVCWSLIAVIVALFKVPDSVHNHRCRRRQWNERNGFNVLPPKGE